MSEGRLRVLLVNGLRTVGGEERTVVDLAVGLAKSGHAVHVACDSPSVFEPELLAAGVAIHALPLRGKTSVAAVPRLRGIVRRVRPELVHFHGSYSGLLGICALATHATPTVWTIQLHPSWNNPAWHRRPVTRRVYAAGFRFVARRADAVVCVSSALADSFGEFIAEPSVVCCVVHNGISVREYNHDPSKRALYREQLGIPEGVPVVGLIGRLTARKGIATFLDALSELPHVTGLVAGGGDSSAFQSYAESRGVGDRVRFLGVVSSIIDFISAIDVGVLPSLGEGLPLSVMEMLAGSVPVVVSDIPEHREFLSAGRACLMAPPNEPAALAKSIREMLERAKVPEIRFAARRAAEEHFSSSTMIRGYLEQYRSLLSATTLGARSSLPLAGAGRA